MPRVTSSAVAVVVVCLALASTTVSAFNYLPGVPRELHEEGAIIPVTVNSLRSLSTLTPYEYYKLPFCKPKKVTKYKTSLGEILWGDMMENSLYNMPMLKDSKCSVVPCSNYSQNNIDIRNNLETLETFINQGYRGHMSIDNLPVFLNRSGGQIYNGRCTHTVPDEQRLEHMRGYAIGVNKMCTGHTLLNNHLAFTIQVHPVVEKDKKPEYAVVGFTQIPHSVKHSADGQTCNNLFDPLGPNVEGLSIDDIKSGHPVWWTYSVRFLINNETRWATRWDAYLATSKADSNDAFHWRNIVLSLVMSGTLAMVATMMLMRALHKDFNRYNSPDPDDLQEEIGWKLVHNDVFRSPPYGNILSGIVSNGVQLTLMCLATLVFALMGLLSPANRGALLVTLLLLFVAMCFVSGYVCGHLLKLFDRKEWKWVFLCGGMFPGIVFLVFIFTDILNYSADASTAVPALYFVLIFGMWLFLSNTLTVLGAAFAFHQETIKHPIKVGKLAREIPLQRWYHCGPFLYIVPPMLPLGVIYTEIRFILYAVWLNRVYAVFGFLAITFILWIFVAALVAVIATYFRLCYENYRWWWASTLTPGGMGGHLFLIFVYYYIAVLDIQGSVGTLIYFSYSALLALAYGVASASVGFIASFLFARKIYSSIKLD